MRLGGFCKAEAVEHVPGRGFEASHCRFPRCNNHPGLGNGLQPLLELISAPFPSLGISVPLYRAVFFLGSLMQMLQWPRST